MDNAQYTYTHVMQSAVEVDKSVIKSAQRVLQVFEFFSDIRKPVSATEIANALSFPQSSTSMLLRSLVSLGYLDYHREDRTFEPTIRLSLLGGWIPERIGIASHIMTSSTSCMRTPAKPCCWPSSIGISCATSMSCSSRRRAFPSTSGPASCGRVCTTAHGRMLLTLNSERDILAIVNRANAEEPDPASWINRTEFIEIIKRCREEGFSHTTKVSEDRVATQAAVLLPAEAGGRRLSVGIVSEMKRYAPNAAFIRERLLEIGQGRSVDADTIRTSADGGDEADLAA